MFYAILKTTKKQSSVWIQIWSQSHIQLHNPVEWIGVSRSVPNITEKEQCFWYNLIFLGNYNILWPNDKSFNFPQGQMWLYAW